MNDEIVEFIRYIFSNEFSSDYDVDCKVSALYVKTSLKENGIGTKLLNHVMDEFRKEDKKKMILWCLSTNESSIHFYEKMEENIKTFNDFRFNLGINDPDSIFYIEAKEYPKPNFRDVADIIHKAGGLVFLAYPYEFRFEDTIGYIDYMRSQVQVDGIECFHPSAETDNRIETLIKYARDNNLYISGESDFHGPKKPNIFIGIGSGSLNIPDIYIEEWAREYV